MLKVIRAISPCHRGACDSRVIARQDSRDRRIPDGLSACGGLPVGRQRTMKFRQPLADIAVPKLSHHPR
jgi:hypothetical protein